MACALALACCVGACSRRSRIMRNDAGDPIMCATPFESHPCTVGEFEDALHADVDGCAKGDPEKCRELGWRYRSGMGVPRDETEARRLFARACAAGNVYACPQYVIPDAGVTD
jgi:TPR repeat protein